MRERLIELLDYIQEHPEKTCLQFNSKRRCEGCKYDELDDCKSNRYADYLIENGVVLPPCKVGDEVYYIINGKIQELRVDYGIFDEIDFTMSARCKEEADMCEYSCSEGKTCGIGFGYSDIGKTVFLSREDAEAKLKGDEGK